MKKVILASLLACAAIASGMPFAYVQAPAVPPGTSAPPCALPADEFKVYNDATTQKDLKAMAAAIEAYLTAFPTSACPGTRLPTMVYLMAAYDAVHNNARALDAADRVLKLDPNNLRALYVEASDRESGADAITDPTANQAALDAAADYAKRGLAATQPSDMDGSTFKTMQAAAYPVFYSIIAFDAFNKKDMATAVDNYKKELASVPAAQTQAPGLQLLDTYKLAYAYLQSIPPDLLDCAFYAARFVDFAPEPLKSQFEKTGRINCYKKFHGSEAGYDAFLAAAKNGLTPPDGLFAAVTPAPTPAEIIHDVIATTPDLSTLAISDRELIVQNGSPEDVAKLWDAIKSKTTSLQGTVIASTPTQVQLAVSDDSVEAKTADFTFNLAPPEDVPEPKATATPAQKAAYQAKVKAAKKTADAIAAATAVGQIVTLEGTYDSYTAKPLMFVMSEASVVLPKPAAKPAAPAVHRTAPH